MTSRIFAVDPTLTPLLAQASYNAYYSPGDKALPGYDCVDHWTGQNPSILGGDEETYGLVYRSQTNSDEYIFAFKGTASAWDAWEDIFIDTTSFEFHRAPSQPPKATVAAGFFGVYASATPSGSTMQDQLFQLIDKYNPSILNVTGHSLGSALAELFTLDFLVSGSPHSIRFRHINFACPRVGLKDFASLYDKIEIGRTVEPTVRVVNYWDEVPCQPPSTLLGYQHTSKYFLISFKEKDAWVPHYLTRHSIYNYRHVLSYVVQGDPQVYVGDVAGEDDVTLASENPGSHTECDSIFEEATGGLPLLQRFFRWLRSLFRIGSATAS